MASRAWYSPSMKAALIDNENNIETIHKIKIFAVSINSKFYRICLEGYIR
jgi:hypothetical protein